MSSTAHRIFFLLLFFSVVCFAAEKPSPENGIFFSVTAEGPRIEKRLCGAEAFGAGQFYYFHKNKKELCAHGVTLSPGVTAIRVERTAAPVTIAGGWQIADGIDSHLLFDPAASFEESTDETGRALTEGEYGGFTDASGALQVPRFIRRNGAWEAVTPLRELFLLQVQKDRSFALEIVTAAPLTDAGKDPARFFGLATGRVMVRTQTNCGISFTGAGFSKIRLPALAFQNGGDSFGRYRITVKSDLSATKKGTAKKRELSLPTLTAQLTTEANGAINLEITVKVSTIPTDDAAKLTEFLRRELPNSFSATQ